MEQVHIASTLRSNGWDSIPVNLLIAFQQDITTEIDGRLFCDEMLALPIGTLIATNRLTNDGRSALKPSVNRGHVSLRSYM